MAGFNGPAWTDEEEQDVRPYAVTGGRTKPRHTMRLESLLAAGPTASAGDLGPEASQAVALCRSGPRSVAELAAVLRQPVQVTRVVLSDLIDSGALRLAISDTSSNPHDPQLLEALLARLERLPAA
ncbi:DUF742 domain-containing protein [Streptomyces sp. NPDC101227]|uniref:DUF742 domain-containing protein n=1 Tax=Streptomyces sp. NPDC101227 TaxID=3366136 RepID=UPI0038089EF5